ncbi:MAG TPA: SPOR domain-containing protein [Alphaproteobacteria bacterium]
MSKRHWRNVVIMAPVMGLLASCGWCAEDGPPQFAELVPVAMMQAALPPPPPPVPVQSAKVEPMSSGTGYGAHLASYFREADALRGWNIIVNQQSSIGSLTRHVVPVQTPKGTMIRLIAGDFPNAEEATRFCTWARGQGLYCAVMPLAAHDQAETPRPDGARPAARRARRRG